MSTSSPFEDHEVSAHPPLSVEEEVGVTSASCERSSVCPPISHPGNSVKSKLTGSTSFPHVQLILYEQVSQ